MNLRPEELASVVAAGEGRATEFKRGLPGEAKLARTLAAFANTRGGLLLIGVGDRGEIVGAPRPDETIRSLRDVASRCVAPALAVDVQRVRLEGKTVVACSVPLSAARPHAALRDDGTSEVVVRSGSSNRVADGATAKALARSRAPSGAVAELGRRILEWVRHENRRDPVNGATVAAFCAARNVGKQRARRAFLDLELAGQLVGHGPRAARRYTTA